MGVHPYQPADAEQVIEVWRLCGLVAPPNGLRQDIGPEMQVQPGLSLVGCRKINLQVCASNTAVIGFYERLGFSVEERVSLGKLL